MLFMLRVFVLLSVLVIGVTACATRMPMPTMSKVDVSRYMGSWYVLASIPTLLEKEAYNAVETYALQGDGTIATTFTFHKGSVDGPLKTLKPRGFVLDSSGAVWGMQILWPIKSDYRIAYLNDDYSQVIVGRTARDHVWIMSRKPEIPQAEYQRLVTRVSELGYDVDKLVRVPQRWTGR
jgi:apolipoprotein D and lipocalin family protein